DAGTLRRGAMAGPPNRRAGGRDRADRTRGPPIAELPHATMQTRAAFGMVLTLLLIARVEARTIMNRNDPCTGRCTFTLCVQNKTLVSCGPCGGDIRVEIDPGLALTDQHGGIVNGKGKMRVNGGAGRVRLLCLGI